MAASAVATVTVAGAGVAGAAAATTPQPAGAGTTATDTTLAGTTLAGTTATGTAVAGATAAGTAAATTAPTTAPTPAPTPAATTATAATTAAVARGPEVLLPAPTDHAQALSEGIAAHTCAILAGGSVRCWGDNTHGQLGYGDTDDIGDDEDPSAAGDVDLPAGYRAVQVVVGEFHTCALLTGGQVSCWGLGTDGRLGYGNTSTIGDNETPDRANPFVALPGGRRALQLSAGQRHTCALLEGGFVACWGDGTDGRLGYGNVNDIGDNETPAQNTVTQGTVPLAGGYTARAVTAGYRHTCALLLNYTVTCWGDAAQGQLGFGNTIDIGDNERADVNAVGGGVVPLGTTGLVRSIAAGYQHTCVIMFNSSVKCWGSNEFGQLGQPGATNIGDNETVAGAPAASTVNMFGSTSQPGPTQVSAGYAHTCVRLPNSADVKCWGAGSAGRLGYGNVVNVTDHPYTAATPPLTGNVREVVASNSHTCALVIPPGETSATAEDGEVLCWGYGADGRLGHASTANRADTRTLQAEYDLGTVQLGDGGLAADVRTIQPARLYDTRAGQTYVGGVGNGVAVSPAAPLTVVVAGRGGVSAAANAAILTVTATQASANGFVRAYPCDGTPTASLINLGPGRTVANTAPIDLSATGTVCIASSVTVHVIVDVTAFTVPGSSLNTINPLRMADTRPGLGTADDLYAGDGIRSAGSTYEVIIGGRPNVSAQAQGVWLNVTGVGATSNGFVTAYPCGAIRPTSSTLNVVAGVVRANAAMVDVGTSGKVCFYTHVAMHLVVDIVGYTTDPSAIRTMTPARLFDSRLGQPIIDGGLSGIGPVGPGIYQVELQDRVGIPRSTTSVIVNITAIGQQPGGYLVVWPCTLPSPTNSHLNMQQGVAVAAPALVEVSQTSTICYYTNITAHVIVDISATLS